MRTLVTNDDGVASPGLVALARVAVRAGHDVVVAAPSWDSSGASASLTSVERDGRFLAEERSLDELGPVPVYAVEASPAFIVMTAARGAFGPPPELVLSGVNLGANCGHAVLHSGTVGAALTASTYGCAAMAVSIQSQGEVVHWATATAVAATVFPRLDEATTPAVLNLNVPNRPLDAVRGVRRAQLAAVGAVQATVTEEDGGYRRIGYRAVEADDRPGTDVTLLAAGYATLTPLLAVCEAEDVGLALAGAGRP